MNANISWVRDFINAEIGLWEYIDTRLKAQHAISLAFFEVMDTIDQTPDGTLRIGDIAQALRITVGAASKLIDRVEAAGLVARHASAHDRRVSHVMLTARGRTVVLQARASYGYAAQQVLYGIFTGAEQTQLHALVGRLAHALAVISHHAAQD